jgi:hypothetical protein
MGLDYSYLLYFNRRSLWDALQGVAGVAEPSKLPTLIALPDAFISLHLETCDAREHILKSSDPELCFKTALKFKMDEEVAEYIRETFRGDSAAAELQKAHSVSIGYIYLTVYNDLGSLDQDLADPELVAFEFLAATTRMSLLFAHSGSVRRLFAGLLKAHQGVCGVLNMEQEAKAFWLDGRSIDEPITNAFLHPRLITERLGNAATRQSGKDTIGGKAKGI